MILDKITSESKADIAEASIALFNLLQEKPLIAAVLQDRLIRICAWGTDYALEANPTHRRFIEDACHDLGSLSPHGDAEVALFAAAHLVVAAVRGAAA